MPAEQIFCSECGSPNAADAAFCESCGQRLEGAEAAAPAAVQAASAPAAPGKGVSRSLLLVVGLVVVLAGSAYAFRAQLSTLVASMTGGDGAVALPDTGLGAELADTAEGTVIDFPDTAFEEPRIPPGAVITGSDGTVIPIPPGAVVSRTPRRPDPPPESPTVTREVTPPPPPPPPAPQPPPPPLPASDPGGTTASTGVAAAPAARIAAGSSLALKATSQLCTDKSKVGDRIAASLQQEVSGANGARIPQGSLVTFVVDQLRRGDENTKVKTVFSVTPKSIAIGGESYPLTATVDTVVLKKKGRGLLGALVGAAAGVVTVTAAGGNTKEAVAGAVVGGAAGAVVGSQLEHGDGCIEKNALMRITLTEDLTLGR
jgi:hypothetical protein